MPNAVQTSLLALFFPFNILYRSSRKFFLGCFRRLVIAPLIKVNAESSLDQFEDIYHDNFLSADVILLIQSNESSLVNF